MNGGNKPQQGMMRGRRVEKENPNRINGEITAPMVRIVGENVEPNLVVPIKQALAMADEMELDLIEISPNAEPPVCRIADYQKFLYQQKRKAKEIKAKQVKVVVKEIRFGPQTDDHDYNFKLKIDGQNLGSRLGNGSLPDTGASLDDERHLLVRKVEFVSFFNHCCFSFTQLI